MQFNSSLVREKFIIRPVGAKDESKDVVALSNRMVVPLHNPKTDERETYVIRAQNMHTCVRMAALAVKEFQAGGPLFFRKDKYFWIDSWKTVTKGYEKEWNPNIWGVIYHKGRPIFQDGDHHPFLDIIEQCDAVGAAEYSQSILFAEEAFAKAGKDVGIEYDSNVALIVAFNEEEARCGIIFRGARRKSTFNFTAKSFRADKPIQISQSLTVSAAFLEGVQLAFQVGLYNRKLEFQLIERYSDEDRKGQRSTKRVASLNSAISQYEYQFQVKYRPERPSFQYAIEEAEEAANSILANEIREKIENGELASEDWIE